MLIRNRKLCIESQSNIGVVGNLLKAVQSQLVAGAIHSAINGTDERERNIVCSFANF